MGGIEALNDFTERLCNMGDLKHEERMGDAITELELLIRGVRIEGNSVDNSKISAPLAWGGCEKR